MWRTTSSAAAAVRLPNNLRPPRIASGKMLGTGLLVYGSYFFWFFVPLTAMVALLGRRHFGFQLCSFIC